MKNVFIRTAALMLATTFAAPAFASDTQVKGKIFYDFSQVNKTIAGTKTKTTGGTLSRTYLTVKHTLDDTWKVRLTLDTIYQAKGTPAAAGKSIAYVKYANLTGSFMPEFNVKIGIIETAWIGHEDHLSGHRYLSKSFVDQNKWDDSADSGIGAFGKVADGMLNYDINVVNGAGYKKTSPSNSQDINARVGLSVLDGLTIDLGYRDGYRGTKTLIGGVNAPAKEAKSTLTQVMVTYGQGHDFRVAAGYAQHKIAPTIGVSTTDKGLNLWAWANFTDQLGAFANYEEIKYSGAGLSKQQLTTVSVDYKANKKVKLSLVATNIKNLGGTSTNKESIVGLYSQFKF
ncbi:MAG: hypothetical protein Q9M11_04495 [Mariprofundaceae bacterium]|nr:hypothetical protein [Mariprofundaceae bacterium]